MRYLRRPGILAALAVATVAAAVGCAPTQMISATEDNVSFSLGDRSEHVEIAESARMAAAHCARYGKQAVMTGSDQGWRNRVAIVRYDCREPGPITTQDGQ